MKLSKIMRYILADSQKDYVPLTKEVEFINNYIELQQVRLTDKVTLDFTVSGEIEPYSIAPLLFIPFIENAFKYGVSTKEASTISIHLTTKTNRVIFDATNYIVPSENNEMEKTGIGINNVKRRLELLYPGKHKLTCEAYQQSYTVHLEINIE